MISASPATIAAVDLGSNSFHMIVARTEGDSFRVVDRMRGMVRLAAGLDDDNRLSEEAIARSLTCLERFGERVRDLPPAAIRVVGTNTLRKARNAAAFISRAEAALGHHIDIISGYEEARLIYLGVAHGLDDDARMRLVVDIGGGSTELILGRRFDPMYMESLHMGCVGFSAAHFADGVVTPAAMAAAGIAARQELEPIKAAFRRIGWQSTIGASGTILAVHEAVIARGWSNEGITRPALTMLQQAMCDAGSIGALELPGLSDERRPVFAGGVAILAACFDALGIAVMRASDCALREGLLYDLLGRIQQEDVRERTIAGLAQRYQLDREQAARVGDTAQSLLAQVAEPWHLDQEESGRMLRWAAALHEIGLTISHSQYHKHGAYLLTHLDMPGFSYDEQRRLALLVRGHRRKLPAADLDRLPQAQKATVTRLCIILRLAAALHRSRSGDAPPALALNVKSSTLRLQFPDGWLKAHPLMRADLEQEANYLKAVAYKLKVK